MKYQESYTEFDPGLLDLIKNSIPTSFTSALQESGTVLDFPQERGIELKLKYDVEGGSFSLKFSWDNESEENDEADDEED